MRSTAALLESKNQVRSIRKALIRELVAGPFLDDNTLLTEYSIDIPHSCVGVLRVPISVRYFLLWYPARMKPLLCSLRLAHVPLGHFTVPHSHPASHGFPVMPGFD
jgi:hypothetical protein